MREFTVGLFILRCKQLGFSIPELDELTIGQMFDVFTENSNDELEYDEEATDEDIMNL